MPLQKIYFNNIYLRKLGKWMEAEACIVEYYKVKRLYRKGAMYAILASVLPFL